MKRLLLTADLIMALLLEPVCFTAQPIDAPGHDHVELPLGRIATERIERRAPVPAPGAADAVILVDLDDLTAHAARDLAQLALLIGRGLFDGADTKVDNRSAHSLASPFEMLEKDRFC